MLVRRAQAAGQSLQQYLAAELARLAATPTFDEVLARIDTHAMARLPGGEAVRRPAGRP